MSKNVSMLLVLFLVTILVGCRSDAEPSRYSTALEAYEQIKPAMLAWHEDAVVLYILTWHSERPDWRIRADGRSSRWSFSVCSPSAQKGTRIAWIEGRIRVGMPDVAGGEVSTSCRVEGVPLDSIIDSDRACAIALENGAGPADTLIWIRTYHDRRSWEMTFGELYDLLGEKQVLIDAMTGEVVQNDFRE